MPVSVQNGVDGRVAQATLAVAVLAAPIAAILAFALASDPDRLVATGYAGGATARVAQAETVARPLLDEVVGQRPSLTELRLSRIETEAPAPRAVHRVDTVTGPVAVGDPLSLGPDQRRFEIVSILLLPGEADHTPAAVAMVTARPLASGESAEAAQHPTQASIRLLFDLVVEPADARKPAARAL